MSDLKTRSDYKGTWNQLAGSYDGAKANVAGAVDEAELDRTGRYTAHMLTRFTDIKPTDVVMEIGCGVGRVGKLLAPSCGTWIGGDVSGVMLEHAKQRLGPVPNVQFVELSGLGLDGIADASIDVVYCTVVFMHLFEWDRFTYVKEALRVLRPGGRCFFDNVDITSDHGKEFFALSASHPIDTRPPHIGMVSSGDELRSYGEWSGMADIDIHRWDNAWVGLTGTKPV